MSFETDITKALSHARSEATRFAQEEALARQQREYFENQVRDLEEQLISIASRSTPVALDEEARDLTPTTESSVSPLEEDTPHVSSPTSSSTAEALSLEDEVNVTSSTTGSATETFPVQEETRNAPSTTEPAAEFLGLGLPKWVKEMAKVLSSHKGDVETGTIININSDQTVSVLWDGILRDSQVEYSVHVSSLEPFVLFANKPTRKRKKISPYSPPRPGSFGHGLAPSSTSRRSSSSKKKKAKSRSSSRGSEKDKKTSSRMGRRSSSKQLEGGRSPELSPRSA